MSGWVYFLRPVGRSGPTKIGYSKRPDSRLVIYAAWSPVPLELVAKVEGSALLERRFHAKFEHLRTHGEWFSADPELIRVTAQVREGTFDLDSLPAPKRLERSKASFPKWTNDMRCVQSLRLRTIAARKAGFDVPEEVWPALDFHSTRDVFDLGHAVTLWRWLESVRPMPDSISTRHLSRLAGSEDA